MSSVNEPDPLLSGNELPTFKFELEKSVGKVIGGSVGREATVADDDQRWVRLPAQHGDREVERAAEVGWLLAGADPVDRRGQANRVGFEGALGKNNTYSDNFFAFTFDFNKDGWDDILIYGFPGADASWFENPKGKKDAEGTEHWLRHKVFDVVDNESPTWGDLTGDGRPEIVAVGRATANVKIYWNEK